MIVYRGITFAGEIEVGMVGQVEHCRLRRRSRVLDGQLIFFGERVDDFYRELTWVAFFSVGGDIAEADLVSLSLLSFPYHGIEAS